MVAKSRSSSGSRKTSESFLDQLALRFKENPKRHPSLAWEKVRKRLEANPSALRSLEEMESTGGEPDVLDWNSKTGAVYYVDFSAESPAGRRSLCYDEDALKSRKSNKPAGSAQQWAEDVGVQLIDEATYFKLQEKGPMDQKTSSWLATPSDLRAKGGALFGDHRFGRTFIYHNGAESYYAARGFRVGIWI